MAAKRVESFRVPCLDACSTPATSTNVKRIWFIINQMRFLVVLYPLLLAERMSAQRPFAIRGGHFYATQNVVSVVCPAALGWRWPESGLAGVRHQEPSGNPEELAFGEGNPQRPVGCLPEIVSCRIAAFHTPQQRAVFAHGGNLPEPPGDIDHTVAHLSLIHI